MFGFLNIYKPKGISSFNVIRKLRKILKTKAKTPWPVRFENETICPSGTSGKPLVCLINMPYRLVG